MNILFLGERRISKECISILLEQHLEHNLNLKVLVSNEAFYKGFCNHWHELPQVEFISNRSRNEKIILSAIQRHKIEAIISVQHIWILPKNILDAVNGMAFNLHNAKLPDYRGFNSIFHAIANGEKNFFSTLHWMSEIVDTGDIIIEACTKIDENDCALSLYKKTVDATKLAFTDFLNMLQTNNIPRKKINASLGAFYRKNQMDALKNLTSVDDDNKSRFIRASFFPPYEPAYIYVKGKKVFLVPDTNIDYLKTQPYNISEWEFV